MTEHERPVIGPSLFMVVRFFVPVLGLVDEETDRDFWDQTWNTLMDGYLPYGGFPVLVIHYRFKLELFLHRGI